MSTTTSGPTYGRIQGPFLGVQPTLHGNSWMHNQVNIGNTPMGMIGGPVNPQLPGPGGELGARNVVSPIKGLFNENWTGSPFGFVAQDNIGPMVIDEHHVGKVNPQITAIATFLSVIIAGSWVTRISRFNITNKPAKWRRYDISRVVTAQRVGHTDIPKTTTNRSIQWMTYGERYGTAADARLQELQDPELGGAVAQRMINQDVAGMLHRLQLAILEQCFNEGSMRDWFESAGKYTTSEAFMDDAIFNRRRNFGMFNYSPGILTTKLDRFINQKMGNKRGRIVGCLPYVARHRWTAASELSSMTYARQAGPVIVDPFLASTLTGYSSIDRSTIFPTDATLLGDNAPKVFATLGDVPIHLETAPSLNLGEQDSGLSNLRGHSIFSTYHENPPFNPSGVLAAEPNCFQVYSQSLDNYAYLTPNEMLKGVGLWNTDEHATQTTPGHFPNSSEIDAGFSHDAVQHVESQLRTQASMSGMRNWWNERQRDIQTNPRAAALKMTVAPPHENMMNNAKAAAMSPFFSFWNNKIEIAHVVGHMHPENFLHGHAVKYATDLVAHLTSKKDSKGMQPDAILGEMDEIISSIRGIAPTRSGLANVLAVNTKIRSSPFDNVVEIDVSSRGGLAAPDLSTETTPARIAGFTSAPALEALSHLTEKTAGPAKTIVKRLQKTWPHFKSLMAKLYELFPFSFPFATNMLPAALQPEKANYLAAAVWNLWPGAFIRTERAGFTQTVQPNPKAVAWVREFLFVNNVLLLDEKAIRTSGRALEDWITVPEGADIAMVDVSMFPDVLTLRNAVAYHVETSVDEEDQPAFSQAMQLCKRAYDRGARSMAEFVSIFQTAPRPAELTVPNSSIIRLPLVFDATIELPDFTYWEHEQGGSTQTEQPVLTGRLAEEFTTPLREKQITRRASAIMPDSMEGVEEAADMEWERMREAFGEDAREATDAFRGEDIDVETDPFKRARRGITTEEVFSDYFQRQFGSENQRGILTERLRMLNLFPQARCVDFVVKCLYTTPNTYDAMSRLCADNKPHLLPVKLVALRLHQRLETYSFMLIEVGGPVVDTTPSYTVLIADQARDYAILTMRAMQNISLLNFDSVAIADDAYVREQITGRDVGIITPAIARVWSENDFKSRQSQSSVVVLAEPIYNNLGDVFTLDNTLTDFARRTLREKGIPAIGISQGMGLAKATLERYFDPHHNSIRNRNLSMPGSYSQYTQNLEALASMVSAYKTDIFMNKYIYRGYTVVRDQHDEIKHLRGFAGCEINAEEFNMPGCNSRIINQMAIDTFLPLRTQHVM